MRLLHPLAGSNLSTFYNLLQLHRPFDGTYLLPQAVSLLAILTRWPFYSLERLANRKAVELSPPPEDPIFIVGHWRSGTTHLHNLVSQDTQFGTVTFRHTALPWDFLNKVKLGARILEWTLPENRGMDNVSLSIDSPQEEEMALGNMGPLCYYNCYYFPEALREEYRRSILFEGVSKKELDRFAWTYRYLLSKLSVECEGKRLLLKNPASTSRMLWLKKIFPKAKFVHIHRNPYQVFTSTLRHYDKVMSEFALQPYEGLDYETITLENYRLIMQRYLEEYKQLPKEDLIEVTYDAVTQNPLGELTKIYDHFGLFGREEGLKAIEAYLKTIKDYRRGRYTLNKRQVERIQSEWGFALNQWGYELPEEFTVEG